MVLAPDSTVKLLKNPVLRVTVWKMHDDMIHIKGFIVLQNSVNFPVIGSPKLVHQSEPKKIALWSQRQQIYLETGGKSPRAVDIGEKHPRIGDDSENSPRMDEIRGPSPAEDASIISSLTNMNLQHGQTKERSRWAAEIAR